MGLTREQLLERAKTVRGWRTVHDDVLVGLAEAWGLEIVEPPAIPAWRVLFFASIHREETTVYVETANEAIQAVNEAYPGCLVDRVHRA